MGSRGGEWGRAPSAAVISKFVTTRVDASTRRHASEKTRKKWNHLLVTKNAYKNSSASDVTHAIFCAVLFYDFVAREEQTSREAHTGARPSDGRTHAMASKRITKELQVRVRAVRLGARLDRARVARCGGFPGSPRVERNERDGEACRVSSRAAFGGASRNASRTSPRPSPPGQNRANRLTTTIRVFSTRNRISKRIPRRPAAPGRGRTMTFSTGTPPSSDLRTRPTRVAFSSWPFTCVSPPPSYDTPGMNANQNARARVLETPARDRRGPRPRRPLVADPVAAPRLSSPAIWR